MTMFYSPYYIDMCSLFPEPAQPKWYNPVDRNNYRKIHHTTLRRIIRLRNRRMRGLPYINDSETCSEVEDEYLWDLVEE